MDLRPALAGGGAVLAVGAFILGSLFGEGAKPVEHAGDAAEDVGLAPAVHSFCHNGWEADEVRTQGIVSLTCEKDGVTVILDDTGRFNIAHFQGGRFTQDESQVPGW